MILLDGKATALAIRKELASVIAARPADCRAPGLAVVLVGDDPASHVYVRNKAKACAEAGICSIVHRLPANTTQKTLLDLVAELNARTDVDGILLQLPLPDGLDSKACLQAIDPAKDVDGFHPQNVGRLALGLPCLAPCTPAGIIELLQRYGLDPAGKRAVVVGRSNIVGRPLGIMLGQDRPGGNATTTVCHSRSTGLAEICREADFLFLALGRPRFVTASMVKEGAVVVDVGMHRTDDGLCGDVDFASVSVKAAAITPVPGGIGPMTIAMLLKNTVQSWQLHTAVSLNQ